jgi:hypothetical protein
MHRNFSLFFNDKVRVSNRYPILRSPLVRVVGPAATGVAPRAEITRQRGARRLAEAQQSALPSAAAGVACAFMPPTKPLPDLFGRPKAHLTCFSLALRGGIAATRPVFRIVSV